MDYLLTEDQIQIRHLVRRIAQQKVAPRANEIDRSGEYPEDMFQLLKELGLFTLPMPSKYGGSASALSAAIAVEELARVCYNTAYLLVVQWTPIGAVLYGGTAEQRARLLPGLSTGEIRASISVTEAQGGSDVAAIRTTAKRTPGGYKLSGSKAWCTGATFADIIFVAAKMENDKSRTGITLFIVKRDAKGLQIGKKEEKTGARGIPSCAVFLDDVFVKEEDRLGDGNNGFKLVMEAFNTARPIHAARGVGLAQGSIDHATAYVQTRSAFGSTVGEFQGVRWMLADMTMQTEAARSLVYRVAKMVDNGAQGKELAPMAAMAKCFATDVAMKVSVDAVQLFGAAGISSEYPINRYMRDAKVLQIIEGTNQIQRNIIANAILGPSQKEKRI